MPCFTYLNDGDYTKKTSDSEINNLLELVKKSTTEDWRVRESEYKIRKWFRKTETIKMYALFLHVGGPEFQIINFYRPDRVNGSINHENEASVVAAFLNGYVSGIYSLNPKIGQIRV